jgi:hypothetical protein
MKPPHQTEAQMEYQSTSRVVTFILCAMLLISVALGCKQFARKLAGSNVNGGRTNTNRITGKAVDGLTEKSDLYIKQCFNRYSNSVEDSYRRYASWLKDVEQGPTGKEATVYGLTNVNGDGKDCIDGIKKAKSIDPAIPEAETAADGYATALKEAIAQISAIYPYYDHEDYKDDGFQRGKTAHAALLASFRNFQKANVSFGEEVDKLEDAVANNHLNEYNNDPSKKYEYAVVETGIKSKNILRFVKRTEYSQIRAEDLQPMIESFEKSVDALKAAAANHTLSSLYVSSCDAFLKAAKELMRRVRDKQPFSDFERRELGTSAGWMVEGSTDKLINKYNDMIERRGMGM